MTCKKLRLDELLVRRGLCESREKAKRLIMAGKVSVRGHSYPLKPATRVEEEAEIVLLEEPRFVGRGGEKLEHALRTFGISVAGRVFLDVGASTGGFTDCLLQWGARKVFAVDVGFGQLHEKLRSDPRVVVMERCNARFLDGERLGEKVDGVVIDVSFISLCLILPAVAEVVRTGGDVVALVKPQFEAGKEEVPRGGVVRKRETHEKVLKKVIECAASIGFLFKGLTFSPLRGDKGNIEFFVHWVRQGGSLEHQEELELKIRETVNEAHRLLMGGAP
jgi:23S rRNA (cytidine1920-2'-O)/16S rRNA (cytidine1409-2'-O)-methyltransferase